LLPASPWQKKSGAPGTGPRQKQDPNAGYTELGSQRSGGSSVLCRAGVHLQQAHTPDIASRGPKPPLLKTLL